jgi:uncharacterized protein YbjQ (UPF0145 family)
LSTKDDDDDITRIEDLPSIEVDEDEDNFADLDTLAKDMGIEDTPFIEENEQESDEIPDLNFAGEEDLAGDDLNAFDSNTNPNFELDSTLSDVFDSVETEKEETPQVDSFLETEQLTNEDSLFDTTSPDLTIEPEINDFTQIDNDVNEYNELTSELDTSNSDEPEPLVCFEDTPQITTTNSDLAEKIPSSQLVSESDLSSLPKNELETKTQIVHDQTPSYISPESFDDITEFGENVTYGNFTAEGSPPFSIIIKNLKYYEDIEAIIRLLLELSIIQKESITEVHQNLERGQILLPRLSEYAAIILCHKLRIFDLEILMGLTEEINPPKTYTSNDRGLITKAGILNNRKYHKAIKAQNNKNTKVLTTTLASVDGHQIIKHLGIVTHSQMISGKDLTGHNTEDSLVDALNDSQKDKIQELRLIRENLIAAKSEYSLIAKIKELNPSKFETNNLEAIYQGLIEELKQKAQTKQANAIIGINFSVQPIAIENYLNNGPQYQITCSGNMAWVE